MPKVLKLVGLMISSVFLLVVMVVFEIKQWPVGNNLSGVFLGALIPFVLVSFQDLGDNLVWKSSQQHLLRTGLINKEEPIRISFAYLFRIKVDNAYLLIKNSRGSEQYQPVGGVYQYEKDEETYLKNHYHIIPDNKILRDDRSERDYRLLVRCKYLRRFVWRFNSRKASRERIEDLGREFKEELGGVLKWDSIKYRYCGRHMSELHRDVSSGSYTLLLADIVELMPTDDQKADLKRLMSNNDTSLKFVSAEEIKCRGAKAMTNNMKIYIADNGYKILEETEQELIRVSKVGRTFTADLNKEY